MFPFPRQSWLHNGLHRTESSSIPHQTLLPMDPFSPNFLLLSRSALSPLLTTLTALSSSSHSGGVGISSPSSAKAWGNPTQDFLSISGKTREDPELPHGLEICPCLCATSTLALDSAGKSIPQTLELTASFLKQIKSFTHSLIFLHPGQMGVFGLCLQVSVCILKSWTVATHLEGMYWTKIMCLVSFQMKTGRKHSTASFIWMWGRTYLLWGWLGTGIDCQERFRNLLLWKYSKVTWTWSWVICSKGPWLREIGLDVLQLSFPAWIIFVSFN